MVENRGWKYPGMAHAFSLLPQLLWEYDTSAILKRNKNIKSAMRVSTGKIEFGELPGQWGRGGKNGFVPEEARTPVVPSLHRCSVL